MGIILTHLDNDDFYRNNKLKSLKVAKSQADGSLDGGGVSDGGMKDC